MIKHIHYDAAECPITLNRYSSPKTISSISLSRSTPETRNDSNTLEDDKAVFRKKTPSRGEGVFSFEERIIKGIETASAGIPSGASAGPVRIGRLLGGPGRRLKELNGFSWVTGLLSARDPIS